MPSRGPRGDASERRSGNRTFDTFQKERTDNRGHGSVRGRGGAVSYNFPQQAANHQYAPNHLAINITNPTYSSPRSPTFFQQSPSSAYLPRPQHSRSYRGSQRPHSLAVESGYGRQQTSPNGTLPHAAPLLQTYNITGGYEYPAVTPMSAVTFPSYVDSYSLIGMVSMQL
jgi:la-related protein 1